jgi:hypothetical protein
MIGSLPDTMLGARRAPVPQAHVGRGRPPADRRRDGPHQRRASARCRARGNGGRDLQGGALQPRLDLLVDNARAGDPHRARAPRSFIVATIRREQQTPVDAWLP